MRGRSAAMLLIALASMTLLGCPAKPATTPELLARGDLRGACGLVQWSGAAEVDRQLVARRGRAMLQGRLELAAVSREELARLIDHPLSEKRESLLLHYRFVPAFPESGTLPLFKLADGAQWSDAINSYDALVAAQEWIPTLTVNGPLPYEVERENHDRATAAVKGLLGVGDGKPWDGSNSAAEGFVLLRRAKAGPPFGTLHVRIANCAATEEVAIALDPATPERLNASLARTVTVAPLGAAAVAPYLRSDVRARCDGLDADACLTLAESTPQEAERLRRRSCALGSPRGCVELADHLAKPSAALYQQACTRRYWDGCRKHARATRTMDSLVPVCVDAGDGEVCNTLGLAQARDASEEAFRKALSFFSMACRFGAQAGCDNLAELATPAPKWVTSVARSTAAVASDRGATADASEAARPGWWQKGYAGQCGGCGASAHKDKRITSGPLRDVLITCKVHAKLGAADPFSAADLSMSIQVGGREVRQVCADDDDRCAISAPLVTLATGESIRVYSWDRDDFTGTDHVVSLSQPYAGTLPLVAKNDDGELRCDAYPREVVEALLPEELALPYERVELIGLKLMPDYDDWGHNLSSLEYLQSSLGCYAGLVGWADPRLARAIDHVGLLEQLFDRRVAMLIAAKHRELPAPGADVHIKTSFAEVSARVIGIDCAPPESERLERYAAIVGDACVVRLNVTNRGKQPLECAVHGCGVDDSRFVWANRERSRLSVVGVGAGVQRKDVGVKPGPQREGERAFIAPQANGEVLIAAEQRFTRGEPPTLMLVKTRPEPTYLRLQ